MKWDFTDAPIADAPHRYTGIQITEGKENELVREGEVTWLRIGVGPWDAITLRKFRLVCRTIILEAKKHRIRTIAIELNRLPFTTLASLALCDLGREIVENMEMANFAFTAFKTGPKEDLDTVEEVLVCGDSPQEMRAGFARGKVVADGVNSCRALANTPGADMTPKLLTAAAKKMVKGLKVKVRALGRDALVKEGMGAVLGVAKGSAEEPQCIILEYKGSTEQPMVLVGKGVTFDSGGLNIKTEGHMYEMHMDMSGGAACIAAVAIAAKLKLKRHVVAIIPAVENMSSSNAVRPGDILRTLSGKTVEVIDTDAEGRLILADALTYAKRYDPSLIVDVATLTGSSIQALGFHATALLTRDEKLASLLAELGEASGEYVWRMPLWEEYEEGVKGTFADLANLPEEKGMRKGDVVNAATFLLQFVKECKAPWAHLDIAPRMTAIPADKLAKGAAGAPVRLLVRLIETWQG